MSKRDIPIDEPEKTTASGASGSDEHEGSSNAGGEEATAEERIAALERDNQRLREQALRAVADLENFRRRAMQERDQVVLYGNERLLRAILPIVDDFHRSVESGAQTRDFDSFYQGVSMINDKVQRILEAQGVKRMQTIGEPFNVDFHEALMRQPSDAPEDSVISELEPGYTYGDKVLRHAKVIVSAGN